MPLRSFTFDHHRIRAFFYLIFVPMIVAGILIAGYLNHRSENTRASRQAEINKAQITVLRHALSEACHSTTVLFGITTALSFYIQTQSPSPNDPVTKLTEDTLTGYANDLNSLTACQNIARP